MGNRLQDIADYYGISLRQLAERIGVDASTIEAMLECSAQPSSAVARLVLASFPDIKAEWLMRGEGQMVRERTAARRSAPQSLDRIKKVMEYAQLSDRMFAVKCGIEPRLFLEQAEGLRQVDISTMRAVALAFPEVSGDWLLTGRGPMFRSEEDSEEKIERLVDVITTMQKIINELKGKLENNP